VVNAEARGDKALRITLEVPALLLWVWCATMTVIVLGTMKNEPAMEILLALGFHGLLPLGISAAIFGLAERRIRPVWRTVIYVVAPWAVIAAWAAWK
jgi:hypothetical protein